MDKLTLRINHGLSMRGNMLLMLKKQVNEFRKDYSLEISC